MANHQLWLLVGEPQVRSPFFGVSNPCGQAKATQKAHCKGGVGEKWQVPPTPKQTAQRPARWIQHEGHYV